MEKKTRASRSSSLSRRSFLGATLSSISLTGAGLTVPAAAKAQTQLGEELLLADLRGSLDVSSYGVRPGAVDNQSAAFQAAVNRAAADGQPLFVPAGDYLVSNIDLPSGLTLVGVPGQSRIRYAGDGHLLFATGVSNIRLEGLVLDGNNRPLADYAPALLHISTGVNIAVEDCMILGSLKDGVMFDRVAGRIETCTIAGIIGAAFVSNDAQGLTVTDNVVTDCADNGILIHRWSEGRDATRVTGNRIERIRAASGGTGPFGNGINVFRADEVLIANNTIHDCDFSAIRCNAASNMQVVANHCTMSGETALFAEFGFQGAVIANNIIDDAASGIMVTNFLDGGRMGVVQGNIVRNLTGQSRHPTEEPIYGVGIGAEADTVITSNVVENAPHSGINAGWGPYLRNVIISQNIIRRTPIGTQVSVVDGVGPTIITDNIFEDTPEGAIVGMHWLERVTGDLTMTRSIPDTLTIEGNRTLS